MIEQLQNLMQQFAPSDDSGEDLEGTQPESLPKTPETATVRHLAEFEQELDDDNSDLIGLDLSLTVGINGAYVLFLLNNLTTLTPGFGAFSYHLLSIALNSVISLPQLAKERVNKKYVAGLTVARLGITSGINGTIINKIEKGSEQSETGHESIITEIREFEGFKEEQPPISMEQVGIVSGIILLTIIIFKFFRRNSE